MFQLKILPFWPDRDIQYWLVGISFHKPSDVEKITGEVEGPSSSTSFEGRVGTVVHLFEPVGRVCKHTL